MHSFPHAILFPPDYTIGHIVGESHVSLTHQHSKRMTAVVYVFLSQGYLVSFAMGRKEAFWRLITTWRCDEISPMDETRTASFTTPQILKHDIQPLSQTQLPRDQRVVIVLVLEELYEL